MSVYFLFCYCQFPDGLCRYSMKASKMICIHSCLNISVGFSEGGVSCLQACLSPCTWPIHTQSCRGSLGPAFSISVGQTPLLPLTVSYNDSHSGTKGPSIPARHCTATGRPREASVATWILISSLPTVDLVLDPLLSSYNPWTVSSETCHWMTDFLSCARRAISHLKLL